MTRHEKRLAAIVLGLISDVTPEKAVERLLAHGLLDIRTCEQHALRSEIRQLESQGMPRCGAMHTAAETFNCSYEKVRNIFYTQFKS